MNIFSIKNVHSKCVIIIFKCIKSGNLKKYVKVICIYFYHVHFKITVDRGQDFFLSGSSRLNFFVVCYNFEHLDHDGQKSTKSKSNDSQIDIKNKTVDVKNADRG